MIWPFKKSVPRELREIAPNGLHDLHSHVLWGFDDGAKSPEDSHAMLEGLSRLGYVRVATTPHCNHSMFKTPAMKAIENQIGELNESRGHNEPVLFPGGEIMFGENVFSEIEDDAYPRLGPERTYLLEFGSGPGSIPRGMPEAVFGLQVKQINLVLAHVERCADLQRDRSLLKALITAGALVQVDVMSLAGQYGREPKQTAWDLLELGLPDIICTDLHNQRDLPTVYESLHLLADFDEDEFVRTVSTNPSLILDGNTRAVEQNE